MQASAPGKLILLGEYAVLEHAPALVMAVNRFARFSVNEAAGEDWLFSAPTLGISNITFRPDARGKVLFLQPPSGERLQQLHFFISTLEFFIQKFSFRPGKRGWMLQLNTDEFYLPESGQKLGLGSSAALTAAMLAGLLAGPARRPEVTADRETLFRLAREAHYHSQGKMGSGIDIAASVYGGPLRYRLSGSGPRAEVQALSLPEDLHLLAVWSGASASTRELVAKVRVFGKNHPAEYRNLMAELKDLSAAGCREFAGKDTAEFLRICDNYCETLAELGHKSGADIVSAPHREIRAIVRAGGGVYKPSGAGGGDLGLALVTSGAQAERVSQNILRSGYNMVNLAPVQNGVTISMG